MAVVLRLILLALLFGISLQASASVDKTYSTQQEALTACQDETAQRGTIHPHMNCQAFGAYAPNNWLGYYCSSLADAYYCYGWTTEGVPPPTPEECLERNVGGVADRWYVEGTQPSSYCNAQCTMTVDQSGDQCHPGTNPATGAPVTWCSYGQSYSGAVCAPSDPNDPDGNPEDDNSIPDVPGEWSCTPEIGVCISPEGEPNYCTFTGNPPVRSQCEPINPDSDSDGISDPNDSAPNDPDNGQDGGTGDETDNTSYGGGSCLSPPSSSGDAIAAQIAYQTWATRCAVEAKNFSPVVNVTAGGTTVNVNTAALEENTASLKQDGTPNDYGDAGTNAGVVTEGDALGTDGLDMAGFGWSRTCPAPPTLTVFGQTLTLDTTHLCWWLTLGSAFVLILAALASLRMIGGA